MQRLTHVPPSLPCSIRATFAPSWLALRAQPRPPEPPPITSKSRAARDAIFCSRFDERALKPSYTYIHTASCWQFPFYTQPFTCSASWRAPLYPQMATPLMHPRLVDRSLEPSLVGVVLRMRTTRAPRGWGPRALHVAQRCRHGA